MLHCRTITNLERQQDLLRHRAHGLIEVADGHLVRVRLRPWPRIVSLAEARINGELYHRFWPGDRCRLYFNQPRACPNFLVLKYTVTSAGTTWRTFFRALAVLDQIAAIKGSDAILCEASNRRISDRLLARMGWEPHCPGSRRRHFIKRFPRAKQLANESAPALACWHTIPRGGEVSPRRIAVPTFDDGALPGTDFLGSQRDDSTPAGQEGL